MHQANYMKPRHLCTYIRIITTKLSTIVPVLNTAFHANKPFKNGMFVAAVLEEPSVQSHFFLVISLLWKK